MPRTLDESLTTRRGVASAIFASYCSLGFILCWSRLTALGQGFWHDEIVTVVHYVRADPREILFGTYLTNNHELFSLLGWATSSVVGESEIALRSWSVIPFIAGVVLVTGWLHIRVGALTALLYLFFAALSPQLLDLSRQARGYGLAFLAMSALIVAASEAERTRRSWAIGIFCAAGVVGTWTLPIFGIAFMTTGGVLLANPSLRRRTVLGLAGSISAIVAWYAPHIDGLLSGSEQQFGERISWAGIVTAPIDRLLLPAFLGIDGSSLTTGLGQAALIAAGVLLLASSPLLRERRTALILGSGVVVTLAIVWATRLHVLPRFVSFLLVPLLIFLASGTARILVGLGTRRPGVRVAVALTTLILVAVVFASSAAQITRLPREAHKDAATVIRDRAPPGTSVFAYTPHPMDLSFYLRAPVQTPGASEVVSKVCDDQRPVVLVMQPYAIQPVDVPCLLRTGTRHHRFRQYSRGGEINVWFVPPA